MRHVHFTYNKKLKLPKTLLERTVTSLIGLFFVLTPLLNALVPKPAKAAAPGDVVINEFVSEPNPEWIELYNTTNSPVSLDGWRIRDAADNTFATFDGSDTISGKSFLVVEDNTTLNNGGPESIELLDDSGVVIDTISYPGGVDTPESGQSAGRAGDGADDWMIFNNPTKGTTNNLARVRVHQKHDLNANGQLDWSEAGQHVAGWTIRLYDSTFSPLNYGDSGNEVVTTDQPYNDSAEFRVPPNQDYIVCEVKKEGYTPSFRATITSWVTWVDNSVDNNPSQSDEAEKCIEFTAPAANKVMTHAFGSIPTHDVPAATTQTDEVVLPGEFANEMGTWTYQNDINNFAYPDQTDTHQITDKPEGTTGDEGAVRVNPADGEKWNLATLQYSGTKLKDIAEIGFDVYTNNPPNAYLNLDVNFKHPGFTGYNGRLVYVPDPAPAVNTWTSYEAIQDGNGKWEWSQYDENGNKWPDGVTQQQRTWNEIVVAFPDAYISHVFGEALLGYPFGALYLRSDGTSTNYFDYVYLATTNNPQSGNAPENIRYNFELEEPEPVVLGAEDQGGSGGGTQTQSNQNNDGGDNQPFILGADTQAGDGAPANTAVLGDNDDNQDEPEENTDDIVNGLTSFSSTTPTDVLGAQDSKSGSLLSTVLKWLLPFALLTLLIFFLLARKKKDDDEPEMPVSPLLQ